MASGQTSKSKSNAEWYGNQENALAGVFGDGGIFSSFLGEKNKPNMAFERQQQLGLEQLRRDNTASGLAQSPLGTRRLDDYLTKTNMAALDNQDSWYQKLFQFMQPVGTKSTSRSSGGGVL
jgi:phage FluMu protein gp41